ncbi:MAG: beta-L-arabinofuranosidase domain-containing protein [Planctomycetota bacterium]|jgi:DUF1680 family protein
MNAATFVLVTALISGVGAAGKRPVAAPRAVDVARPVRAFGIGGILGQRLEIWRRHRLKRVGRDPFLLDGFRSPPGRHPWQGEHVGKWLHAATLAYDATGDKEIAAILRRAVDELVDSQHANGYLGTYAPERRFYNAEDSRARWSWDIWTHRYLLYGLITYDRFCEHPAAIDACVRMGDLLLDSFGPAGRDITQLGTRHGLSSAVLLESIMMLYERTAEERFLRFAEHIVQCIEGNPRLHLTGAMREGTDVSVPGDGKAYQLMATLMGYAELYRHTANADYLKPAVTAWEMIRSDHLYETGGPWSYKSDNVKNQECFALPRYFHPTNCVETCSTTTWIQLSLLLWRLTGEPRFADEAERAVFNHLLGAQSPNGNDWAYFTMPNQSPREYKDKITCCASSGPRGLELYARHLAARTDDALVLNSYLPMSVPLADVADKPARLVLEGEYPFREQAALTLKSEQPLELALDFRVPLGADSLEVTVEGQSLTLRRTPLGYRRLQRTWRPGEKALLRFDMPPKAHFRTGRNGERWVAFTRGPLALAQDVRSGKGRSPNVLTIVQEAEDANLWLEPADRPAPVELPAWRFKATRDIVLVPYCLAGSTGGGVRAMFATRPAH